MSEDSPSSVPHSAINTASIGAAAVYTNCVHCMICDAGVRVTFHELGNGTGSTRSAVLMSIATCEAMMEQLVKLIELSRPAYGQKFS